MDEPYKFIVLEREAEKTPGNIQEHFLMKKIANGNYLETLALIAKKLEYILKFKYNELSKVVTLGELLEKAQNDKDIPKTYIIVFWEINQLRINKLHATSKDIDYDPEKMKNYVTAVFDFDQSISGGVKANES